MFRDGWQAGGQELVKSPFRAGLHSASCQSEQFARMAATQVTSDAVDSWLAARASR
jgi:hypothetical protein